jgi:hypothetical protein
MANQSELESAIPLAQDTAAPQLESAGQVILQLLHKAAGAAEANSRRALATAQQLSTQLHATQNRIAELEAEVQLYRKKSERAEDWLRKISAEIEDRLIKDANRPRQLASSTFSTTVNGRTSLNS